MIFGDTDNALSCILVSNSHIKPDAANPSCESAKDRHLSEQKLQVLIDQFSRVASNSSGSTRFSFIQTGNPTESVTDVFVDRRRN